MKGEKKIQSLSTELKEKKNISSWELNPAPWAWKLTMGSDISLLWK